MGMKKVAGILLSYSLAASLVFLYNDWVLGYFLNPHMSANRSTISELSATNQPYHSVFQMLDILAGILTLACVVYMWRFTAQISTGVKKRWLLLGLYLFVGLDSIVDASLPVSCAPSVDSTCNWFASHAVITQVHLIESNVAGTVIAMAPLVWWLLHRSGKYRQILFASIWLVIIELAVGIAAVIVRFTHHTNYGGVQRIYEGVLGIWMGWLAFAAVTAYLETKQATPSKKMKQAASSGLDDTGAAS